MRTSTDEQTVQSAEFACARCWKQKKKCDRVTPQCGRCTAQSAVCIFSSQPPIESAFSMLETPILVSELSKKQQDVPVSFANYPVQDTFEIRLENAFGREDPDHNFSVQVQNVFTSSGTDAESIGRLYFQGFHSWLPCISETEFWKSFHDPHIRHHQDFSTLLLSIFLISHVPAQDHSLESAYCIAKESWECLQRVKEPSLMRIQSGLLLATYENGQILETESRSTITKCAEMGYKMKLHKSLRKQFVDNGSGQLTRLDLEEQRRVWWGLVILERLFAVKDLENASPFSTRHPTLEDYLPPSDKFPRESQDSEVLGIAVNSSGTLETSEIAFDDVDAYPALAQATYLLGRVLNYIKSDIRHSASRNIEMALLSRTTLTFAQSLIRQADGHSLKGHYCTGFFISIIALTVLHRYELRQRGVPYQTSSDESPPQAILALQVLSRMFRAILTNIPKSSLAVLQTPPFELHTLYQSITLQIQTCHLSNDSESQAEFQTYLLFFRIMKSKWRVAGKYLDEINALQAGFP